MLGHREGAAEAGTTARLGQGVREVLARIFWLQPGRLLAGQADGTPLQDAPRPFPGAAQRLLLLLRRNLDQAPAVEIGGAVVAARALVRIEALLYRVGGWAIPSRRVPGWQRNLAEAGEGGACRAVPGLGRRRGLRVQHGGRQRTVLCCMRHVHEEGGGEDAGWLSRHEDVLRVSQAHLYSTSSTADTSDEMRWMLCVIHLASRLNGLCSG